MQTSPSHYVTGNVYDGISSKPQPARLSVTPESILVEVEGGTSWRTDRKRVEVSDRVANIPRILTFEDNKTFVTDDNDGIDRLIRPSLFQARIFHAEMSLRTALLSLVAVIAVFSFLYLIVLPQAAIVLAPKIPKSVLKAISKETDSYFQDPSSPSIKSITEDEEAMVAQIFKELKAEFPKLDVEFSVRPSKMGSNAFALPDGRIIITEDLVKLSKVPDEIRAVLYHEIGHVHHYHINRMLIERSAISLALMALGGTDALGLPLVLMTASYSRDHEVEADQFAAKALLKRGIKPTVLGDVLMKMEKEMKDKYGDLNLPSFLSTHPVSDERMERLRVLSQ